MLLHRRKVAFVSRVEVTEEEIEQWLVKEVSPPSLGTILAKAEEEAWCRWTKWEDAYGQGEHHMLPRVGGHVWFEDEKRRMVYRLNGPCRWLLSADGKGLEELYVVDKSAQSGFVRKLQPKEIWRAQERGQSGRQLVDQIGEAEASKEGCLGTGRKTALGLLGVATELCGEQAEGWHVL